MRIKTNPKVGQLKEELCTYGGTTPLFALFSIFDNLKIHEIVFLIPRMSSHRELISPIHYLIDHRIRFHVFHQVKYEPRRPEQRRLFREIEWRGSSVNFVLLSLNKTSLPQLFQLVLIVSSLFLFGIV